MVDVDVGMGGGKDKDDCDTSEPSPLLVLDAPVVVAGVRLELPPPTRLSFARVVGFNNSAAPTGGEPDCSGGMKRGSLVPPLPLAVAGAVKKLKSRLEYAAREP